MVGRSMGFGMSRHHDMSMQQQQPQQPQQQPIKRSMTGHSSSSPGPAPNTLVTLSFNVPFNSSLAGPDKDDVIYSSYGAFTRWTFAEDTDGEGSPKPTHELPVHVQNVENLRNSCRQMQETTGIQATVVCAEPRPLPGYQRGPLNSLVTNVCLYGENEPVQQMRGRIFASTPISLVSNRACSFRLSMPC